MTFREIEFGSEDFRRECELRQAVLRVPMGLNLYQEDLGLERMQLHFGGFDVGNHLLACVVAVPLSSTEARVRQMAVRQELQGKGYGRTILRRLESHLAGRGFRHLNLHARLIASGFYEKMGYERSGHEFLELGIPHIRMEKNIS